MACVNEKRLVCGKASLLRVLRQIFYKKKRFVLRKRRTFSAHARQLGEEKLFGCKKSQRFQLMQSYPIKESLFSA